MTQPQNATLWTITESWTGQTVTVPADEVVAALTPWYIADNALPVVFEQVRALESELLSGDHAAAAEWLGVRVEPPTEG